MRAGTQLAKHAGTKYRSSSFSSDHRTGYISVQGNNMGVSELLAMRKEILGGIHIMFFAGQLSESGWCRSKTDFRQNRYHCIEDLNWLKLNSFSRVPSYAWSTSKAKKVGPARILVDFRSRIVGWNLRGKGENNSKTEQCFIISFWTCWCNAFARRINFLIQINHCS